MNGSDLANAAAGSLTAFIVVAFLAGAALVAASFWLLPMLWGWLRPILHGLTA